MNTVKAHRPVAKMITILLTTGCISLATAGVAAAKPDPDDYYPPIINRLSEQQVETMKENLGHTNDACSVLPLPYLPSVACRNGKALEEAVNKAYYRDTGLIGKYHIHKGVTSLNYYDWQVDGPPAGRAGSGLPVG